MKRLRRCSRSGSAKDPGNPVILFLQAACLGHGAPDRAPNHYVEQVFDDLADSFDTHLLEHLDYRAPTLLHEALAAALAGTDGNARHSGCRLRNRPMRARFFDPTPAILPESICLPGMLAKAKGRKVYDDLIQAELTDFLDEKSQAFDIIASADTLCYFGDAGTGFQGCRRGPKNRWLSGLHPGGSDDETQKLPAKPSRPVCPLRYPM